MRGVGGGAVDAYVNGAGVGGDGRRGGVAYEFGGGGCGGVDEFDEAVGGVGGGGEGEGVEEGGGR